MKSALLVEPRYQSSGRQFLQRRRVSKMTSVQNNDFDHDLALAIEESLKYARQTQTSTDCKENKKPMESKTVIGKTDMENNLSLTRHTTPLDRKTIESTNGSDLEIEELKNLLLVHVDLIQHQSDLVAKKDKEISKLKADNDSLKCRLERMTRRMSLVRQRDDVGSPQADKRFSHEGFKSGANSLANLRRLKNARKNITFLQKRKRRMINIKERRPLRPPVRREDKNDEIMCTECEYYVSPPEILTSSPLREDTATGNETVPCPSWRVKTVSNLYTLEGTENLEDEIFNKRHQKMEQDEKRRKRWDLQRMREEKVVNRLRDKENEKDGSRHNSSPVVTFYSPLESVTHIEVVNKIPVTAFGRPVPTLKPIDFELPWKPAKSTNFKTHPKK